MRLFQDHHRRETETLAGLWQFAFREQPGELPTEFPARQAVPGCWDASVEYALRRGVGHYRRTFEVVQRGQFLLRFDGVANLATVRVDGRVVAEHYGSHTTFHTRPFSLDVGLHEVIVSADNRFGEHNALLEESCGWYCFGGIHRGVRLERVEDVRIDRVTVATESLADGRARLRLAAVVSSHAERDVSQPLRLSIDGLWSEEVALDLPAGASETIERVIQAEGVEPWQPGRPRLYIVRAECACDDLVDRFGIRTVRCEAGRILLNGEPIQLRGINHHDYHPESGYASDLLRMKHDLDLVHRLGLNFIRTSHYPKDRLFLDLCDEMGLMVLEEATGWQNGPESMRDPRFTEQLLCCIDEMVLEHANHPCVIIWGLLNEVRSEYADLRGVFETAIGRFRQIDTTRPVTYATNRLVHVPDRPDRMADLVDILCPNLYNRWYADQMGPDNGDPKAFLEKQIAWYDAQGFGDKPILIGEFGAGGQAGCHRLDRRRWSEEHQADVLDEAMEIYHRHPRLSGYAIWLLADTACSESEELRRPGSMNCKGLFDANRNPKLACYRVADFLSGSVD